jgi:hypothetical protein
LRDGFVVSGPVGAQQGDVGGLKGLLHLRLIQSDALVHLAAQAPACGEVHKDRTYFLATLCEVTIAPRLCHTENTKGL